MGRLMTDTRVLAKLREAGAAERWVTAKEAGVAIGPSRLERLVKSGKLRRFMSPTDGTYRYWVVTRGAVPARPEDDLALAQRLIAAECDAIKTLLLDKNQKYGNSALDPVRVFSKAPPDEQILTRLDDKISRLTRGEPADEDVMLDLVGYAVLYRVQKKFEEAKKKKGGGE